MAGKRIRQGVGRILIYLVVGLVVSFLIVLVVAYYAWPVTAPLVHLPPSAEDAIPAP